ncbi:Multidrug resistance protein Stp [Microbacterium lemovicicum]|uniref:Multidrug resistance protein Stp n=1 Tax=Microbacterium lemovicicum TaxID=1072463 RepID=A0A3Q9IZS4_9MICO|nr:MFS transporter [Microbacterium lemovicicum]AZS37912.1 Multidrug resistance protein Stp [Microbacterium lemovicicum]
MSNASPNAEPIAAPPQRTENLALIVVCAAQFVLQLDFSVVNVALPSIRGGLGFSDSDLQWIVTGYALTFGALLLFGGRAGDLFGQRRMLLLGLVVFGVGSIGGGLAPTPEALIAARFVQGAAGALISLAALSSLTLLFPDGAGRIRALGIWQGATAAGGTAGIVLGGLLVEVLGWRSVFIINVPIVIALVVLVPRVIPRPATRQHVSLHLGPSVLITAAIALVIFALSNLEQSGPTSIVTLVPFIAGLGVAAVTQKRSHDPLIPKVVLRSRQRRGALVVMLIAGAVLAAYVYFVSLYLQTVLGLSPLLTGVSLLPATLTIVVLSSFIARRVIERIGLKSTTIIGALLVAAGQTWFVSVSSTGDYLLNVLPALILTASGIGLLLPAVSIAATADVASDIQGAAASLLTTSQQVGAALGVAALATIAATRTSAGASASAGYSTAFLVSATAMIVAVAVVAVTFTNKHPEPSPPPHRQPRTRRRS